MDTPLPRYRLRTVMHGMTQTGTSSTADITSDRSTRGKSERGPREMYPHGLTLGVGDESGAAPLPPGKLREDLLASHFVFPRHLAGDPGRSLLLVRKPEDQVPALRSECAGAPQTSPEIWRSSGHC